MYARIRMILTFGLPVGYATGLLFSLGLSCGSDWIGISGLYTETQYDFLR